MMALLLPSLPEGQPSSPCSGEGAGCLGNGQDGSLAATGVASKLGISALKLWPTFSQHLEPTRWEHFLSERAETEKAGSPCDRHELEWTRATCVDVAAMSFQWTTAPVVLASTKGKDIW